MKTTKSETEHKRPRSDRMHEIEGKHFGRCIDQMWDRRRMTLIELMDWPKGRDQVVLVKQFDHPVPRSGSGKPWPDLTSCYVYVPLRDHSNTWDGLDAALTEAEAKVSA